MAVKWFKIEGTIGSFERGEKEGERGEWKEDNNHNQWKYPSNHCNKYRIYGYKEEKC